MCSPLLRGKGRQSEGGFEVFGVHRLDSLPQDRECQRGRPPAQQHRPAPRTASATANTERTDSAPLSRTRNSDIRRIRRHLCRLQGDAIASPEFGPGEGAGTSWELLEVLDGAARRRWCGPVLDRVVLLVLKEETLDGRMLTERFSIRRYERHDFWLSLSSPLATFALLRLCLCRLHFCVIPHFPPPTSYPLSNFHNTPIIP